MMNDDVIGVILEIGMLRGVDRLAVYTNRSARYDSFAGAKIAWQRPDDSLDVPIDGLLTAANEAFGDTAPMDPREALAVRFGEARVVLLMPEGERGVSGTIVALSGNPRLGNVLRYGSVLIRALVVNAGSAVSV